MTEIYSRYSYPSQIEMDDEGDNDSSVGDVVLSIGNPQGQAMERFLNDPDGKSFADRSFRIHPTVGSLLAGRAQRVPQPPSQEQVSDLASSFSSSDLSTETSDNLSRFLTNGSTSSGVTLISESAHQPDPSIMLGPLPSHYTMSAVGDFGHHDHATPAPETRGGLPFHICTLGVIDGDKSRCHEALLIGGSDALYRHLLTHFDPVGPPGYALCVFCNAAFENESKPKECWRKYSVHLYESHFRNGAEIDDMRPDFRTFKYMLDKHLMTQERYDWICRLANERKGPQYENLMPPDWVPNKVKSKEYLAEDEEYNRQNLVVRKNETRPRKQGLPERESRGYHR